MNEKTLIVIALLIAFGLIAYEYFFVLPTPSSIGYINKEVPANVINELKIPENISDQIGIGLASNLPKMVNGTPILINGKPTVLYISAEYCPFCAAERWALVIALLRFGNFTKLHYMASSAYDYAPDTPTFTFYNSSYNSNYINFVAVELTTRNLTSNNTYQILQRPNAWENATFNKYDPNGSIPFLDINNETITIGANYDPMEIEPYNYTEIIDMLYNSSTPISRYIIGSANLITAQICKADGNKPVSVCNASYVKSIESKL